LKQRGLYLSVTPVATCGKAKSYTAFSGTTCLVKEMKRFSQQVLDEYVPTPEQSLTVLHHVLDKNHLKLKKS
jgi:hypothetical protein